MDGSGKPVPIPSKIVANVSGDLTRHDGVASEIFGGEPEVESPSSVQKARAHADQFLQPGLPNEPLLPLQHQRYTVTAD